MSQYFLGLVGRQNFFFGTNFLYRKSIKIIKKYPKIKEKFSDVPKIFGVGPKKVESVGFPAMRHFFFLDYDFDCTTELTPTLWFCKAAIP